MSVTEGNEQSPTPSVRPRIWKWLLLCVIALFAIALAIGLWFYTASRPVQASGKTVEFVIQPGESSSAVAQKLAKAGLIRNATVFRTYLWLTGGSRYIQAGRYLIRPGTGFDELAVIFERGRVTRAVVSVLVPEGYTVRQIANRLEESGVCSAKGFIAAEEHDTFSEPFLTDVPQKQRPPVKYRLEGYLFPATYEFERGTKPHVVVDEMLQTFNDHYDDQMKKDMAAQHLTLAQTMTEASLIEKEAKVNSERPIIASVLHNRLVHQPPMKLQIDATIEYIIGYRSIVTDKDLLVQSPYNTYANVGLPPGPICNPGLASIHAVLHRSSTPYLFYVVKNDKSGEHYFSATYADQLKNEARSQQNLRKYSSP